MTTLNYLSNKELLNEIHKSKLTFCSLIHPDYQDKKYKEYDVIVQSLDDITDQLIEDAKASKAIKIYKKKKEELLELNFKPSEINIEVSPDSISTEELVFRLMTDEHIPTSELKPKKKKKVVVVDDELIDDDENKTKVNFPPFKHYVMRDSMFVEVLRSHWHNGTFNVENGKITNKLAMMFIKIVERYAQRGNWRGYCVDSSTQALTQRGWLYESEITTDDIILSIDINDGQLKWSKIKSIYRDDQYDGKMFHITSNNVDSFITPGHKFITQDGLKEVEHLRQKDRLIWTGTPVEDGSANYSDELVELVGWYITEGNVYERGNSPRVTMYQNEGVKADRIRNCLEKLNFKFCETIKENVNNNCISFQLNVSESKQLMEVSPDKNLTIDFLLTLSQSQRELLINTIIDGDGWRRHGKYPSFAQKSKARVDMFMILLTMAGYRFSCQNNEIITKVNKKETNVYVMNIMSEKYNRSYVENIDFHGANTSEHGGGNHCKSKENHPNVPTVDYTGMVWCPETEYGTFIARRNDKVYATGNSYLDEMKGQALLQLSQMGLQFDESRSNNPFAYFTTALTNSFTRILNIEKKNQNIRDDILQAYGHNPSFTRQLEHEKKSSES